MHDACVSDLSNQKAGFIYAHHLQKTFFFVQKHQKHNNGWTIRHYVHCINDIIYFWTWYIKKFEHEENEKSS